jgi:hypothetical protein
MPIPLVLAVAASVIIYWTVEESPSTYPCDACAECHVGITPWSQARAEVMFLRCLFWVKHSLLTDLRRIRFSYEG